MNKVTPQHWSRECDFQFVRQQLEAIFEESGLDIRLRKNRESGTVSKPHILPFAYRWTAHIIVGDWRYDFAIPEKELHHLDKSEFGPSALRRLLRRNSWFVRQNVSTESDIDQLRNGKRTPDVLESSSWFLKDVREKAQEHAADLEAEAAARREMEALVEYTTPTDTSQFGLIGVCAGKIVRVPVVIGMDRLVCVSNAKFFEAFEFEAEPIELEDDEFLDNPADDDDDEHDDELNIAKGVEKAFKNWLTNDFDKLENIKLVGVLSDKYGELVTLTVALAGRELTVITSLPELQKIHAFTSLKMLNDYLPKRPKAAKKAPAPLKRATKADDDDEHDDSDEEDFND